LDESTRQTVEAIQADVSQHNIIGSAQVSAFGLSFGQSFVPSSLQPVIGVGPAVVNSAGVGDAQISRYRSGVCERAVVLSVFVALPGRPVPAVVSSPTHQDIDVCDFGS
jgi:hypothetical protein